MKRGFRITYNARVTITFALICFAVQLLDLATGGRSNEALFSVYRSSLLNPLTWLRFVGHIFGHAGWDHLIGNMMYLLILGPMLEEKYGTRNMVIVIVTTALVTGISHFILFPRIAMLGASGVVFAFILLSSITGFEEHTIPLTFLMVAALYLGQQIYDMVTAVDNISHLSHILGGATGAALGFAMNRRRLHPSQPVYGRRF